MIRSSNFRIASIASLIVLLDQLSKYCVIHFLGDWDEKTIIPGFFKLVHWSNTGAAWSTFTGKNNWLALIAIAALIILYRSRRFFEAHTWLGQLALGLVFGGIIGNLIDRVHLHRVTDFLYFYLQRRGAEDINFPAFNIADSAICVGVGLVFIMSWRKENTPAAPAPTAA